MRAIYGSAYGRKAATVAAGAVSKEIMERIGFWVAPWGSSLLFQAVRLIVKAAVQIWRRARLEWDVIHSTMPSVPEMLRNQSPAEVMLWIRPHVMREQLSANTQQEPNVGAFIYLQGTAIRHDSPLVLTRRQDLITKTRR